MTQLGGYQKLGHILVQSGLITKDQLQEALNELLCVAQVARRKTSLVDLESFIQTSKEG